MAPSKSKIPNTPQLSIVILSYNVSQLLKNCLQSLYADPSSKNWQIIVVDNASQDDSVQMIKHNFKSVIIIQTKQNLGFSTGNNQAVSQIKAPYTLFLNPDTIVPVGTINTILDRLRSDPQIGAATCKVVLGNGQIDDGCHRGFPTPWNSLCHFSGLSKLFPHTKLFASYSLSYLDTDESHPIDALTGAFMMLPTTVGQQLNWWDEDYFFNGEDLDFCYRINQAGYKIMYYPRVTITHFKGASGGYKDNSHGKQTVDRQTKINTAKASTQAMRIFYDKHSAPHATALQNWLVHKGIAILEWHRTSKVK